jgi:integration host factor subunit alpha
MTKAEIIDAVYDKVGGFSKKEAAEIVESVFDTMKEVLAEGEKIKISGFGNFDVRPKRERVGRNPQTGAPIPISARKVLTFKPSQVLKGILNPHKSRTETDDSLKDRAESSAQPPVTNGAPSGGGGPVSNGGTGPSDGAATGVSSTVAPVSAPTPSAGGAAGADESSTQNG